MENVGAQNHRGERSGRRLWIPPVEHEPNPSTGVRRIVAYDLSHSAPNASRRLTHASNRGHSARILSRPIPSANMGP